MDGVGLAVVPLLNEHSLLVRAKDILRAEDCLPAWPAAISGIDIVVVAYPIEVAALEPAAFANHDLLLAKKVEVLVKLTHLEMIDAADDIDFAAVEEHARVVVVARESLHGPFALGVCRRE